jgi:hypothetical protein
MNPCINIPVLLSATLAMASATSAQISATFIAKTSEIPINTAWCTRKTSSSSWRIAEANPNCVIEHRDQSPGQDGRS